MAHKQEKRAELRRRYVVDRQPLTAAAEAVAVSYSTARSWKDAALGRGDDWDHARMAEEVGSGGVRELTRVVLEEFVPLFRSTISELKTGSLSAVEKAEVISRLSDAYTKTVKASGAVDPTVAKLGWAMEVMRLLAEFTAQHHPKHQVALLEVLEPFGEHLGTVYG